jgi:hypothetical protein
MTDELEQERADLLAAIDSGQPITQELADRIGAVAAADAARPRPPIIQALAEILDETVSLADGTLPPGLDIVVVGETIQVLSRGRGIATVSRQALAERADQIAAGRN